MSHPSERVLGAPHVEPVFTARPLVDVSYTTVECVVCGNGADDGDTCEDCGPVARFDVHDPGRSKRLQDAVDLLGYVTRRVQEEVT